MERPKLKPHEVGIILRIRLDDGNEHDAQILDREIYDEGRSVSYRIGTETEEKIMDHEELERRRCK